MKTKLNIENLTYSEYGQLLKLEQTLKHVGNSSASRKLHKAIEAIDRELKTAHLNNPEFKKMVDTIEENFHDFNNIAIQLDDYSIWKFAWFGSSRAILSLTNFYEWRNAFIWEVKDILIGKKTVKIIK